VGVIRLCSGVPGADAGDMPAAGAVPSPVPVKANPSPARAPSVQEGTVPAPEAKIPAPQQAQAKMSALWPALLPALETRVGRAEYMHLLAAQAREQGDALTLELADDFSLVLLKSRATAQAIEQFARELFGKNISVRLDKAGKPAEAENKLDDWLSEAGTFGNIIVED